MSIPNTTDQLKEKGKSFWQNLKGLGRELDEMTSAAADAFDQKEKQTRDQVTSGLEKAQDKLEKAKELIKPK